MTPFALRNIHDEQHPQLGLVTKATLYTEVGEAEVYLSTKLLDALRKEKKRKPFSWLIKDIHIASIEIIMGDPTNIMRLLALEDETKEITDAINQNGIITSIKHAPFDEEEKEP